MGTKTAGTKPAKSSSTTKQNAKPQGLPSGLGYFIAALTLGGLSLWIRTGFPIYAITNASYDDLLFVRLAQYIHSGQWLGPYDQLTLVKGMVYSLFMAGTRFVSLPLKVAEQIAYLAVCGFTAELVRRRTKKNNFAAVLFLLLAFNPVFWNYQLARVIREGLYVTECLALLLFFVMLSFPRPDAGLSAPRFTRLKRVLLGIGLGVLGAAYWLTREEGIWLAPSLLVVLLIGGIRIVKSNQPADSAGTRPRRLQQLTLLALPLAVAALVFVTGDLLVAGLNYHDYGIFETNEFRSKSFLRAYGALTRIRHDHWQQFVLFPKDARERAYAVSPAARELGPSLEGDYGRMWLGLACAEIKITPCPSEVWSGWFLWELRGAVHRAGHYQSAVETMRFYDAMADQIDNACATGAIPCLRERDSMSPPFRWEYLGQAIPFAKNLTKKIFTLRDGPVGTKASVGAPQDVTLFRTVIGDISSTEGSLEGKRTIQGWAASQSGAPSVSIVSRSGEAYPSAINLFAVPSAAAAGNANIVGFHVETDCSPQLCALAVGAPGSEPAGIPLTDLSTGASYGLPTSRLGIDQVKITDAKLPEDQLPQVRIASALSWVYAVGLPILSFLGLLGMGLAVVQRKWNAMPAEVWAMGLASATAVATRIVLLSYISASSFAADNLLYSSPASTFALVFAAVGVYCGFSTLSIGGKKIATSHVGD